MCSQKPVLTDKQSRNRAEERKLSKLCTLFAPPRVPSIGGYMNISTNAPYYQSNRATEAE